MKVLFTGASGALGRKYLDLFPGAIPMTVRYGDGILMDDLACLLRTSDVLIHASANLKPKSIDDAIKDNAILPFDILEMANRVNPDAHIILISSMSLLGESGDPKRMKDMTLYAASKFIMEEMARKVSRNPVTIVRFSSLFYKDPSRDGLSKMIYTAKVNGAIVATDCRRDFIPLEVACRWLHDLCSNKMWYNKTINLASGRSVNMIDIANYLVERYDVSFHHTSLPDYSEICYRFCPDDPQSLERISFDIYELIDQYYSEIRKESDEQATGN